MNQFCDHFIEVESDPFAGTYCKLRAGHAGEHSAHYPREPSNSERNHESTPLAPASACHRARGSAEGSELPQGTGGSNAGIEAAHRVLFGPMTPQTRKATEAAIAAYLDAAGQEDTERAAAERDVLARRLNSTAWPFCPCGENPHGMKPNA